MLDKKYNRTDGKLSVLFIEDNKGDYIAIVTSYTPEGYIDCMNSFDKPCSIEEMESIDNSEEFIRSY